MAHSKLALCVEHSDPISAHVLYRLLYWLAYHPDEKDGQKWVGNPSAWWAKQTGLSAFQVDRCMARLEALGLIVIEMAPQWKQKVLKCRWVRLSDHASKIFLVKSPNQKSAATGTNGEGAASGPALAPEHITKDSSKASNEKTTGGAHPEPAAEGEKTGSKKLSVKEFEAIWKKAEQNISEGWNPPFSFKEREWAQEVITNAEDQDLATAIPIVVENWFDFLKMIQDYKKIDLDKLPPLPNVLTVAQHLGPFFDLADWLPKNKAAYQEWLASKASSMDSE